MRPENANLLLVLCELFGIDDSLTFIVKGHLYCEAALASILWQALPRPEALQIDRLEYQAKLRLCDALRVIPEQLVPGLEQLGTLRNRHVHRVDYSATEKDQSDFINTLKSTLGEPASIIISGRIEFPRGLRLCILTVWLPLLLQVAVDDVDREEFLNDFVDYVLLGCDSLPDDHVEDVKRRLKKCLLSESAA